MENEIQSATLPRDADIRDSLVSVLRERFGERLVVWKDDVYLLPEESGEKRVEFDAATLQILARAGLKPESGESIAFVGSEAEKRLSRAILTNPTRAARRNSGMAMISRRFSSGELWIAVAEKDGVKLVKDNFKRPKKFFQKKRLPN